MTLKIYKNKDSITLEYIDIDLSIYRFVIKQNDVFIMNFMENNIDKMFDLLNNNENYTLEKNVDNIIIKYTNPVVIKYKMELISSKDKEQIQNKHLMDLIEQIDNKYKKIFQEQKEQIDNLTEQLSHVINVPNVGIIDKKIKGLKIIDKHSRHLNKINYELCGRFNQELYFKKNVYKCTNLLPIKYATELKKLYIDCRLISSKQFMFINYLENLQFLIIQNINCDLIENLDFIKNCKKLKILIINIPQNSNNMNKKFIDLNIIDELNELKFVMINQQGYEQVGKKPNRQLLFYEYNNDRNTEITNACNYIKMFDDKLYNEE